MRLRLPLACASLAAAALAPMAARAGGLLVADTGSQGLQRAGAFHAKADDPTALHYNPAGLVRAAHRYELYVGSHVVNFSQTYQRSGTYAPLMDPMGQPDPAWVGQPYPEASYSGTKPVPMLLATQNFGRFAFGEGLVVPSGYPFRRFNDNQDTLPDGRPAPQRYDIMNQDAFVIFPSVGGAVSIVPELDVGVRLSWGIGRLDATNQTWGITNDAEHPGNDALFRVVAQDSFVPNAGVGLLYRPTPFLELGASYTAASHVRDAPPIQTGGAVF